jgi:acyl-coenzyme A thioesterase PaaI-like protein
LRTRFPVNPFRLALGIEIEIPRAGDCIARMPAVPVACDPDGSISQGAVASLCDVAMGHAIGGQLTERAPFATVHLQIAFHGATGKKPLRGEGESPPLAPGWKEALTSCRILRADGGTCATAQGFFARSPQRPPAEEASPKTLKTPDPVQADAASLPDLLSLRPIAGDLQLLDVRPVLLNPDGVGHGGALAAALDLAMRSALRERGAGEIALRTLDVRYIAPALPGEVTLQVQIDRKGRSIHFAEARAIDVSGRSLCAAVGIYGPGFRD